jgi:protein SCO1/2
MTRKLRILTTALWAVCILSMCALLASWTTSRILGRRPASSDGPITIIRTQPAPLPDVDAPKFSLVDQDHHPFSSDELKGKVWVCDFFFTTCTGPCPILTQRMSQLDKRLTDPRIHFVSFSIDPESDTPAAMKAYGAKFTPSPRWHFLTGPDNATYAVAKDLKLPAVPAAGQNPIFHSTKFVLVSPAGKVAGYYDSSDPASLDKLATDAQALADALPK